MNSIRKYIDLVTESERTDITKLARLARSINTKDYLFPLIEIIQNKALNPRLLSVLFDVMGNKTFRIRAYDDTVPVYIYLEDNILVISFEYKPFDRDDQIDILLAGDADPETLRDMRDAEIEATVPSIIDENSKFDLSNLKAFLLNQNPGFSEAALNEITDQQADVRVNRDELEVHTSGQQLKKEFVLALKNKNYLKSMEDLGELDG